MGKNANDDVFMNVISKLFVEKMYKKSFIPFAAQCIDFDFLFSSFMIIPTRYDEKKIIKKLMQSTAMTLGASWFVVSKEWWDKWCLYTGYNENETDNDNDTDTTKGQNSE